MGVANLQKVLVIEDDPNTANLVVLYLERVGFHALQAHDGENGLALAEKHGPDLVVLALMLPRMDGWEVCRRLRKASEVPVIMLTARGEEIDRVSGLTLGGGRLCCQTVQPERIGGAGQSGVAAHGGPTPGAGSVLSQGDVRLDLDKRRLSVAGRQVEVTPCEYALLEALMTVPGRTFSRDELLDRLYPHGEAVVIERVVDVHIGKLWQKIEPDPSKPRYICTVRGMGYRFADPAEVGGSR